MHDACRIFLSSESVSAGKELVMSSDLYGQLVKDVMSKDVVTIAANALVHDALDLMVENKVSALPVVEKRGSCIGIISTSDFVSVSDELDGGLNEVEHRSEVWWEMLVQQFGERLGQQSVLDLMTEDVVSISPDESLVQAARSMLRERVHHLPVLDENRKVRGIISMTDILRAFVQSAPER
jgi:CBS domain-containing protein